MQTKPFRPYSNQDYFQIFESIEKGKTLGSVAQSLNRSYSALSFIKTMYVKTKQGKVVTKNGKHIQDLAKLYLSQHAHTTPAKTTPEAEEAEAPTPSIVPVRANDPVDHFTKLSQASNEYNHALEAFIEEEVARRVKETQEENQKLKDTVERLNKENDRYQHAFLEAKNSNWVDQLRKKWQINP